MRSDNIATSCRPSRVDQFNPHWPTAPTVNYEAVPLANGWVGAAAWLDQGRLRFDLNHQDFWDFRDPVVRDDTQFNSERFRQLSAPYNPVQLMNVFASAGSLDSSRLPGIALELQGQGEQGALTLKLRQGVACWSGGLKLKARVDATCPWFVLEGSGACPADEGEGPSAGLRFRLRSAFDVADSPVAQRLQERGVKPCRTSPCRLLLIGASRTLGVDVTVLKRQGHWILVACLSCLPTGDAVASDLDQQKAMIGIEALKKYKAVHVREWRRLMTHSLVTLPDRSIEEKYWLGIYLLGCMGRDRAPLMSLQGPWNFMDVWPAWNNDLHHNVNVQMSYWASTKTGAWDCHEGLKAFLSRAQGPASELSRRFLGRDGLLLGHCTDIRGQAPFSFPVGQYCWSSGLWLVQTLYECAQYSGDAQAIDTLVVPWLKGALGALVPELVEGDDGCLHLDCTFSPEYGGVGFERPLGPDSTIDLALIRWAIQVLDAQVGDDPDVRAWVSLLDRLAPPGRYPYVQFWPVTREAIRPFMVRRDLPLETPHRHHSHLITIFPLQEHDPRNATEAELLLNNFKELMFRGHGEWVGFSFVWAAAIAAHARMPNPGLSLLRDYATRYSMRNGWTVQGALQDLDFNTHGQESWGVGVVTLEGPLAFPAAVLEMLLQDGHGRIEVFPAMPTVWPEAAFQDLLARQGVKVSARMEGGRVRYVALEFVRSGSCTLVNPWPDEGCTATTGRRVVRRRSRDIRVKGRVGDRWEFRPLGGLNTRRCGDGADPCLDTPEGVGVSVNEEGRLL